MGTLSVYAVPSGRLRRAFDGSPASVAAWRRLGAAHWPTRPTQGNLDKLGPFSKLPVGGAPVIRPGVPNGRDLDAVAHGRPVPADRRTAAWALLDAWLLEASEDRLTLDVTPDQADALAPLTATRPPVPLPPLPGQRVGHLAPDAAARLAGAWRRPTEPSEEAELQARVATWLARTENQAGTPQRPDLVVVLREDVSRSGCR